MRWRKAMVKKAWDWAINTIIRDKPAAILFALLIITIIVGIIEMIQGNGLLVSAITTFALIIVTALYGWHTRKMANSSEKGLGIAINSMMNGHTPVIKLVAVPLIDLSGMTGIKLTFKNVGPGPALNLRCWIQHDELPHLSSDANKSTNIALGTDEDGNYSWPSSLRLPDFHNGFTVIAQYNDIYGRRFESILEINDMDQSLQYGLMKEVCSNQEGNGKSNGKLVEEKKKVTADDQINRPAWKKSLWGIISLAIVIIVVTFVGAFLDGFSWNSVGSLFEKWWLAYVIILVFVYVLEFLVFHFGYKMLIWSFSGLAMILLIASEKGTWVGDKIRVYVDTNFDLNYLMGGLAIFGVALALIPIWEEIKKRGK